MIRKMKKAKYYSLLFFVILLFSFCIATNDVKAVTEKEPNDSFAQATEVPLSGEMSGVISDQFDDDFWKVTCASNSELEIEFISGAPVISIEIYNPSFNKISEHDFVPWDLIKTLYINSGGVYYIKILSDFFIPYPRDYNFLVDHTYLEDLAWIYPESGYIEFGPAPDNDSAIFEFRYHHENLDNVTLEINGTDYGDVTSTSGGDEAFILLLIPFTEDINGNVTAELVGWRDGGEVIRVARNFTFAKLKFVEYEILNQGVEFLGNKLYSILYDPNGDMSYSGWKEGSTFSLGVGMSTELTVGVSIGVEFDALLCSGEVEMSIEHTEEEGYDFRYETSELSEIKSGSMGTNADEIGPGFGDYFWGEVWFVPWKLAAAHKIFWPEEEPEDEVWLEPTLIYGVNRTGAALISYAHAPEEWKALSLYPDYPYQNVTWLQTQVVSGGGGEVSYWEQLITTEAIYHALTIDIGASASVKIGAVTTTVSVNLKTKMYKEVEQEYSITRYYSIGDDDSSDIIVNDIGYDRRFGTFVFRTTEACFTSNPLEHNTVDYQKPIVYYPTITYDSSGDGLSPCENDEPLVVVQITDEGGIQQAWINYTTNDGISWNQIALIEQAGNPEFWEGQIPSQEHGTEVQWYIVAKDYFDQITKKMDVYDNPFSYTILNRAPKVELISPKGGEIYTNDELTINWTGIDPDEDDLTYSIAYNFNNQGWHQIASELTNTSYIWDISNIDFVENVQIRITANDDYGGEDFDLNYFSFAIKRIPTNATGLYLPSLILINILAMVISVKVIKKRR